MTYMGKNIKKWIYVYVQVIHFAVHLKLMQHCISTMNCIFFLNRQNGEMFTYSSPLDNTCVDEQYTFW